MSIKEFRKNVNFMVDMYGVASYLDNLIGEEEEDMEEINHPLVYLS